MPWPSQATNNCDYYIHAHTGSLKQQGLSETGLVELMGVVGLYNHFNNFLDGLKVDPDLGI